MTRKRLKELLIYDPETGIFTRRISTGGYLAGAIAGGMAKNGYIYLSIDSVKYLAQRVVFFYMTGAWPLPQADHKNGNRADNRWGNLRVATRSQNASNGKRHRDNSSGFKGVYFHKQSGLWNAQIMFGGIRSSLGYFPSAAQAHAAYVTVSAAQHREFARSE